MLRIYTGVPLKLSMVSVWRLNSLPILQILPNGVKVAGYIKEQACYITSSPTWLRTTTNQDERRSHRGNAVHWEIVEPQNNTRPQVQHVHRIHCKGCRENGRILLFSIFTTGISGQKYCCHIWARATQTVLSSLDRDQKPLQDLVSEELFSTLQPLSCRRDVVSRYFYRKSSV